jgi:NhaC family Na+:H+ antiporter
MFGGAMEKSGMLNAIAKGILSLAKGTGGLITATVFTCIGMNIIAADQYLAIVIPGRMYADAYKKRKLHPKNLSRTLEDAGTLTSPLIPWNTCGAYMITTLGVAPWVYVPYCFLNIINPIIAIIYGYTGFSIEYFDDEEEVEVA